MGPSLIIGSPFFLYKKHTEPPYKKGKEALSIMHNAAKMC